MPFLETDDHTAIHYTDWGRGRPVVFIHGWGVGGDMWEYQTTPLSDAGLRCIAYDRRGCGRSSQPGSGYDFDTLADDLATLLDRLDLRDVTLVAHSMGGGEVARYLARHGAGRVAGTVLVGATTPFLLKTADNPDGVDGAAFDAMVEALAVDRPAYLTALAPVFFGPGVSPEMLRWGVDLSLRASGKAMIAMVRTLSETDLRPDLRAFTVPTLVIHGSADQIVPFEVSGRRTAAAIQGCRLSVYEGASHGLFVTEMARLNAELLAFARG